MIEHIWSILCQNCLVDRNTNTISLIEAVEDLGIGVPPPTAGEVGIIPIQCALVSNWERRPADQPTRGVAKFRSVRPTGESEIEQEYAIDLSSSLRSRTIARISGISFRELGRHVFEVYMREDGASDWTKVAAIPINISQLPSPDVNQA
jgi:hypothetical protein